MADVLASGTDSQPSPDPDQSPSTSSAPQPLDSPPTRHIPAGYVVCDECGELVPKPLLASHQDTLCAQSLADCVLSRDHHDICHLHTEQTGDSDAEEGEQAEHTREQIAAHIEQSVGTHMLYLMDVVGVLQQQVAALSADLTVERRRRQEMEDQIKQVITTLAEKVDHAQVARFSAPTVSHHQPRPVVRTTSGRVVQKRTDRDRDIDSYPVRSSLQYSPTFSPSAPPPTLDPLLDKPLAPSASAWKPAVKAKPDTSSSAFLAARSAASAASASLSDPPTDPAQLTKRIHSTLNKLTPTNYDKLSTSLLSLFQSVASPDQLATLTGQLFDKALEDIFFGSMYARLCRLLATEVKGVAVGEGAGGEVKRVGFRYYLLNKCQDEFVKFVEKEERRKKDEVAEEEEKKAEEEKQKPDEETKEEGEEGMSASGDAVGEREVVRAAPKRRFIAAIRFIGELFLQDLVTLPIMIACITQLLTNVRDDEAGEASEDSIQGLCKLLTTVGGKVEEKEEARERMRPVWAAMRAEAEADGKHSSRGRFALLDVLDARDKGWKQREAQKEQSAVDKKLITHTVSSQPVMRVGFDEPTRGGGGGGGGSDRERARERERELIPQHTSDARLAQATAMATTVKKWTPGIRKVTSSADHPT